MTEILAPAGDEQSAYAAINAGANAIYLGLSAFSARSNAKNFGFGELKNLIDFAHIFGVKIYVAMNTLVKDGELEEFIKTAVKVHNLGSDALIIQDIYLGAYLKREYPQMCLHLSTQAGICNEYGAKYAKHLGFSRVILARETKLSDIKKIAAVIETEAFVQGALCTCFSGQCYLSSFAGGNSGNRGKCKQPCRKRYSFDRKGFEELAYRISLSDLSLGSGAKELIGAGVKSFKIEGRMRRPEYVSAAVNYWQKAINGTATAADFSALKRTYNRGNYTKGLAFGQDKSFVSSAVQGHIGEYLGMVSVVNGKYLCRSSERCAEGDGFKILRAGKEVCGAVYGGTDKNGFFIKSSTRLKNGDKVFITTDARLNARLLNNKRVLPVEISAKIAADKPPVFTVNGKVFTAGFTAEKAVGSPAKAEDIKACFNKVDKYPFAPEYGEIKLEGEPFIPASKLNAFRRLIYGELYGELTVNNNKTIEKIMPLPNFKNEGKNDKIAVVASSLNRLNADVGILKPFSYNDGIFEEIKAFRGEKFLYLPPYLTGEEIEAIKPLVSAFDGIYCGGNYAVPLAKELNCKLFAGVGFNVFNSLSASYCPADYIALSKELTAAEAKGVSRKNTFYLTLGDVKVMDLIYCPFGKSCRECDKRNFYSLTDENGRVFPLRRYSITECRFELFNCAELVSKNDFTGVLADLTSSKNPAQILKLSDNLTGLKNHYKNYTKGHTETPVL